MLDRISPLYAQRLNSGLETNRLVIEPLTGMHAEHLFGPMQSPSIYEWISSVPPKTFESLKDWWKALENRLDPEETEAWLNWAVRRKSDNIYVGKLDAVVNAEHIATNVSYLFFPEYWGNGYASEAVLALTNHFASCGVAKMVATVTEGNRASYRVLENAGFIRSRIIPDNDTISGIKYNDVEYIRVV
jgi:RimJ/RimL family protein N-acetyltransferase